MIEVVDGASDAAIADWLARRIAAALTDGSGEVSLAVPGGQTPFPILAELAKHGLEWGRLHFWPTDDRVVPAGHPASNYGRLSSLLVPIGAAVSPLVVGQKVPHFALVWLGMGADGHIASLFPNTDPQVGDPLPVRRLTPDPLPPEAPFDRITLTIPALLQADELLFVIRGLDKRAVLDHALAGGGDWPITRLLAAAHQPITCFT